MAKRSVPLVCFYGDDFTGSSENLAQYHRHGLRSMLFFDNVSTEEVAPYLEELDVLGVAGVARSLPSKQIVDEIGPVLKCFHSIGSRLIQYKICSTFDSSPRIGSFSCPIRLARHLWPDVFLPVLAATPEFGRYTAFGNHFAAYGNEIYRLDRNPSMRDHPSTPMDEADLREHLAKQTRAPVGLFDLRHLEMDTAGAKRKLRKLAEDGNPVVFDGIINQHLVRSARLLWEMAEQAPVFALAAQGLAHGLGEYFTSCGLVADTLRTETAERVDRLLVFSGSCAPQTYRQIMHAEALGWTTIHMDVMRLIGSDHDAAQVISECRKNISEALRIGRDVVLYTAKGNPKSGLESPAPTASHAVLTSDQISHRIGFAFSQLAREAIDENSIRRMIFAGGDTSSYAMRALGAYALEVYHSDLSQSAHICLLHANERNIDGLQVVLKGGQVGDDNLFPQVKAGLPG